MPTSALLINLYCFKALIYEFSFLVGASPKTPSLIDSSLEIKKGKFERQYLLLSFFVSPTGYKIQKVSLYS